MSERDGSGVRQRFLMAAKPGAALWIGPLALLGAVTIWGFVPTSTRHAVQFLTPGHILLARFLMGALAAVILLGLFRTPMPPRHLLPHAIGLGVLGQLGFNVPLAYGIQYVEAGTVSLISGVSPVFMAILASLLLNEKIRARVVIGLGLALAGSALVAVASGGEATLSREQVVGSLLILLSAILWGLYSVVVKPWLGPIPPSSIPMLGSIASLPLVVPLGASGFASSLGRLDAVGWLAVAQFTLLASVTAPILWAVGLQRGQASQAGLFLYLVPLFGVASGALLLGERVGAGTLAGGALILGGVLLATLSVSMLRGRSSRVAPTSI
ncbi:MAG TPA: DMT family transporter [Thermomicrobiales bacterium]|nr:DMT family transporter [Thermomicrobiales bacterium]